MPAIRVDITSQNIYLDASYVNDYFVFAFRKLTAHDCNHAHYHSCYELEFLVEGSLENSINSSKQVCNPGDYWLVLPNNFHLVELKTEYVTILSIKFTEKAIMSEIFLYLQKFMSGLVSTMPQNKLQSIMEDIDKAIITLTNLKSSALQNITIKSLMSQIFVNILNEENFDENFPNGKQLFPDALYDSIKYVKDNFTQKLSRDEVASKFGFSCSYYSTIFKKCTGKSFTDFVLGEKLCYAYYLLLSTKMPIKEVAENSGFESSAYFSQAFKKAYGRSPANVRSQCIS